jgi:hypothetical protein
MDTKFVIDFVSVLLVIGGGIGGYYFTVNVFNFYQNETCVSTRKTVTNITVYFIVLAVGCSLYGFGKMLPNPDASQLLDCLAIGLVIGGIGKTFKLS